MPNLIPKAEGSTFMFGISLCNGVLSSVAIPQNTNGGKNCPSCLEEDLNTYDAPKRAQQLVKWLWSGVGKSSPQPLFVVFGVHLQNELESISNLVKLIRP
eukprot:6490068-Amphidinium_carterae.1